MEFILCIFLILTGIWLILEGCLYQYPISIFFNIPNDRTNKRLDILINYTINLLKVKSVNIDKHWVIIDFQSGERLKFWNENKFYAWCSKGEFGLYKWDNCRPRRKTMYKLYKFIKKYEFI